MLVDGLLDQRDGVSVLAGLIRPALMRHPDGPLEQWVVVLKESASSVRWRLACVPPGFS